MNANTPIDSAGTPEINSLFAVLPEISAYQAVERELLKLGLHPEKLQKDDASMLDSAAPDAGILGTMGRFLKGIGGETNMAKNYVEHLQGNRVVLACKVPDGEMAEKATQVITNHGGYEVVYFRPLGIQYMSPKENAELGLPTHATTNTDS